MTPSTLFFFRIAALALVGQAAFPALAQLSFPYVGPPMNSASYSPDIAQGAIFTIFGSGMGPLALVQANSYPLPFEIGGTSVNVLSGGRTFNCPMFYSSDRQIAAILPSGTPPGAAQVAVTYRGGTGYTWINVATGAFGIYAVSGTGMGHYKSVAVR